MSEREDPIRWAKGGAPEGALALLAELDEPPPLPPSVRRRVQKAVAAEVQPGPPIPWGSLLLAAAVGLLAFAAGWLWSKTPTPPPEPHVAAPLAPEQSEPAPEAEDPAPPPEVEPEEPMPAARGLVEAEAREDVEPAPRRRARRATMRSRRAAPGLVDPFADSRPAMTTAMTASMQADRSNVLDPFRDRETEQPAQQERTGMLVINTIPWSHVFIDGEDTGRNTPVRQRVTAGRHRIDLRTSDGTMHTFTVEVGAGESVRVMRRL